MARAIGARLFEQFDEIEGGAGSGQRAVDGEERLSALATSGPRRSSRKLRSSPELRDFDGDARRHRVAAALDDDAGFEGGANGAADIDAGDGAAGAAGESRVFGMGEHKARQLKRSFSRAAASPDNAGMPAIAGHHHHRTAVFLAQRCSAWMTAGRRRAFRSTGARG